MKERIISAIIALIIVVPLILLGGIFYKVGVCIIALLALKEILDLPKSHEKYPNFIIGVAAILLVTFILSNSRASIYDCFSYQLLALSILFLMLPVIFYKDHKYSSRDALYLLGVIYFLGIVFNLFVIFRMKNLNLFIFLLIIPMINDIFAYLIGCKFGKNKLCPLISPKKTWEGSIGGLVIGTLVSLLIYNFLVGSISIKIIIGVIILSIAGQTGDLVMSSIKRENGVKDFSNIMPGHGGILDRLDSIIFVFITYIVLLGF